MSRIFDEISKKVVTLKNGNTKFLSKLKTSPYRPCKNGKLEIFKSKFYMGEIKISLKPLIVI